jgi:hypothetical protein
VFVLGMHRSGTSAVTRLISLLDLTTPAGADLVPAGAKNPTGYWESMSLVAFNGRVLDAVGSSMSCPLALAPGWEADPALDALRGEAPEAVQRAFPESPWVWKDPRNCLTLPFWAAALEIRPVVVLVLRNPLEVAASAMRARSEEGKIYGLALWERYLRQALRQIDGLPVLVASYERVLEDPLAWCAEARAFLVGAGISARSHRDEEVVAFVEPGLRHNAYTVGDLAADTDVSMPQRALYEGLEELRGRHRSFSPPDLPEETPTTEALLGERRRSLEMQQALHRALDAERQSHPLPRLRRVLSKSRRLSRHLVDSIA